MKGVKGQEGKTKSTDGAASHELLILSTAPEGRDR